MEQKDYVKTVFKNGTDKISSEEYTKKWIEVIKYLEKTKKL